ncbi:non-specific lipid transfer protein GPI-anchored 11-like [Magnolia sinica]|uniref:non-specific lipid transfer protein GPI-anchored 11-like n=1 Tax=Magnolia sinica TaxID=86752 RepID=UPI00265A91D1|nr:non-specific lipid transfer protein GPI-anchored 11-like [Magnolia sinica]
MGKLTWLFCVLATWVMVNGASQAPSPSITCVTGPLGSFSDCITFTENGSMVSKPEGSCCDGLRSVVKDSPTCLCEVLKIAISDFGIALNLTKVLTLPSACGISTPSLSSCIFGGPSPSPAPSPTLNSPVPVLPSPVPVSPPSVLAPPSHSPSASVAPPISPTGGSGTRDPIVSPPFSGAPMLQISYMFALVCVAIAACSCF